MTFPAYPSDAPRRNGMAVAALTLGIIGLLLPVIGVLPGIAAIILGIVAQRRADRRGMSIGGIITGVLTIPMAGIVGVLLAVLVPALGAARMAARETVAMTNIKALESGIAIYAAQYNDNMPQTLLPARAAMAAAGLTMKSVEDPRLTAHPADPASGTDFYYTGNEKMRFSRVARPSQFIVLYDMPGAGRNRLVGFADGHVERIHANSPELEVVVESTNRAREGMGLAPLPAGLNGPPPP